MSIDLFTSNDLQLLRQKQQMSKMIPSSKISTKRYLILIYNVEYDRIYYPLSLRYCGKPDPNILLEQVHRLASENQLLKSQVNFIFNKNLLSFPSLFFIVSN